MGKGVEKVRLGRGKEGKPQEGLMAALVTASPTLHVRLGSLIRDFPISICKIASRVE